MMIFPSMKTGWALYNTSFSGTNNGRVYKTTDGGNNWVMQMSASNIGLRCVGFSDSLHGWIGTLGRMGALTGSPVMYRTTNGGITWDSVTFATGSRPGGLCGISVLNSNHIFACGRVNSPTSNTPPYFIKTTNGGLTWVTKNMSSYASMLIDCKFFSPDSGFVIGGVDTPVILNTKNTILFTSDGGENWVQRYTDSHISEWLWKISFPSRNTGYCSINRVNNNTVDFIKTTNGGMNWSRMSFPISAQNVSTQGIGFLNENTGWIGGDISYTYKTTNGGLNWQEDNFGRYVNRIRFINDSIGYGAGSNMYKFTNEPIGIQQISTEVPEQFALYQNYPNPFNPMTKIKFEIPLESFVTIKIYNALGKEISALAEDYLQGGSYSVNWDAANYPSGIYIYKLTANDISVSKKMILIK
jgi:photosystem II stability/assembly factor-like uncharacterized protein